MQSEWDRWAMRVGIAGIAAMAVMALAMNANAVSDQSWQHRARLDAPQRMLPIGIGAAVAASETGCIAVGGGRDGDVGVDAGAVAIWNCTANSLALREIVSHPAARTNTAFGQAVAFDAAATTLCIGAPNEDGTLKESGKWPENFQMGRVYIYAPRSVAPHETNGAHWQLWATLESRRIMDLRERARTAHSRRRHALWNEHCNTRRHDRRWLTKFQRLWIWQRPRRYFSPRKKSQIQRMATRWAHGRAEPARRRMVWDECRNCLRHHCRRRTTRDSHPFSAIPSPRWSRAFVWTEPH